VIATGLNVLRLGHVHYTTMKNLEVHMLKVGLIHQKLIFRLLDGSDFGLKEL